MSQELILNFHFLCKKKFKKIKNFKKDLIKIKIFIHNKQYYKNKLNRNKHIILQILMYKNQQILEKTKKIFKKNNNKHFKKIKKIFKKYNNTMNVRKIHFLIKNNK